VVGEHASSPVKGRSEEVNVDQRDVGLMGVEVDVFPIREDL